MKTMHLAGLETRVLDEREREEAIRRIRHEMHEREVAMKNTSIDVGVQKVSGWDMFMAAQNFPKVLEALVNPIADPNKKYEKITSLMIGYTKAIDELAQKIDPNYYEFPFVAGKNLILGTTKQEPLILADRENLDDEGLKRAREYFQGMYGKAEQRLQRAIALFKKSHSSIRDKPLQFYLNNIRGELGISYNRNALMSLRLAPESHLFGLAADFTVELLGRRQSKKDEQDKEGEQGKKEEHKKQEIEPRARDLIALSQKALAAYHTNFKEGIFMDEESAAKCLSNTANAMKMLHMLPGYAKKGMEYYMAARDILGNLPEIKEGIEVYTRLGELKKPDRGFLEIIGGTTN